MGTSSSSVQPISAGITPTCPTSNVTQSIAEQGTTQPTAIQGGVPSISTSVSPDPSTGESSVVTPSPAVVNLLHVETVDQHTTTIESDEYVPNPTTHPSDAIVLSEYLWRRAPSIKLISLSELDIDIWCGKVSEYYQYSPTLQIKIVSVKGARKQSIKTEIEETELPQVDETRNLIDHAQSLLELAKVFVTKPVKEKQRQI